MYKYLLPLLALGIGCQRQIDFEVNITIIDTGSGGSYYSPGSDDPGGEPAGEPSGEPGGEPAGEPAGEPSDDPNGGDPNDPNGGNQGGDPNDTANPGGGNQGGDPNDTANPGGGGEPGGGGDPGAFDSCDAYGYCTFGDGFDMSLVMECQNGSSNSDYDDWFSCMSSSRGNPCSGANGGDWSGCDCDAIAQCGVDHADPFD
jgi:hypothetical protein